MVQLPTERTQSVQEEVVDWLVPSDDWPYTGQQDHEMRYHVFLDLWEQGYYVTSGSKFGGDFLVYPGTRGLRGFSDSGTVSSLENETSKAPLLAMGGGANRILVLKTQPALA